MSTHYDKFRADLEAVAKLIEAGGASMALPIHAQRVREAAAALPDHGSHATELLYTICDALGVGRAHEGVVGAVLAMKGRAEAAEAERDELRAAMTTRLTIDPFGPVTEGVFKERQRQTEEEGYDPDHDASHGWRLIARAAQSYAFSARAHGAFHHSIDGKGSAHVQRGATASELFRAAEFNWPWPMASFKPKTAYRDMERAAALLIAAMEALVRSDPGAATAHRKPLEADVA